MKALPVRIIPLVILVMVFWLLPACGGGGGEEKTASPSTPSSPAKKVKITIGNHTDLTGVSAIPMEEVNMGVRDAVRYYNENGLIPGVEVELVEYDGQTDPARDIPGYEWLKERGADVIMVWIPSLGVTLRGPADKDRFPVFAANSRKEVLYPPGYLFSTSPLMDDEGWNLIQWVAENDWDYHTKGPAKVGGAAWDTNGLDPAFAQIKRYAELHPEQIQWVGSYLVPQGSFQWDVAVDALKNCDYVIPDNFWTFVRFYRDGGGKAKFLGTDTHSSFAVIQDMKAWPQIDGMLFIWQSEWWSDTGELPDLVNRLIHQYHSESIVESARRGKGYFALSNAMTVLEIIRSAAQSVGPENVTPQAIYDAAQSFTLSFDGVQRLSYSPVKRTSPDRMAIYRADAGTRDLVRLTEWFELEPAP